MEATVYNTQDYDHEPRLEEFDVQYIPKPEMQPISSIAIDAGFWGDAKERFLVSYKIGAVIWIIFAIVAMTIKKTWTFGNIIVMLLGAATVGAIIGCVIWPFLTAIGKSKVSKMKAESQSAQYKAALIQYENDKENAEKKRQLEFNTAHQLWEDRQKQIQREKEAKVLEEQQKKELRARIQREENVADARMAQSSLVSEIARCIVPYFKKIIDKADRETHMKVRVRLAIDVHKESIDYYDVSDEKNVCHFVFSEEGISEKLTPIMRKALCKALSAELRRLILESYPIDANGQKVQVGLESAVRLESNITYIPGRDYTAPEYDDKSYATVTLLYETFEQKVERYF